MTINDDIIQRAERWLAWYPTRYAVSEDPQSVCHSGAAIIRECIAALKGGTSSSTQLNPSQVDLSAPDWLARYAVPIEGQDAVQRP